MSNDEKKPPHSFIVQGFENSVSKYDAQNLLSSLLGTDMSLEEVELKHKPYGDLLQKCYEKDPVKTSAYLVEKASILLNHAYEHYKAKVMNKGMNESNLDTVAGLIKDWKGLKERVASSERIFFDERNPPSCIINFSKPKKERLTNLQTLEKRMQELKK